MKYENEYRQKAYEEKKALVKKLNDITNLYRFELVEDSTNDSREYIKLIGAIPIEVNHMDYEKKYNFFLPYSDLLYIRYNTYEAVSKKYSKPQNIGVLTERKVKAWIEYLTAIYNELVPISEKRVVAVRNFENEMIKLGGKIGRKDAYGAFEGYVIKNGIELKFIISNEGYISKKIEIYYKVSNTLESFLRLADNKYTES